MPGLELPLMRTSTAMSCQPREIWFGVVLLGAAAPVYVAWQENRNAARVDVFFACAESGPTGYSSRRRGRTYVECVSALEAADTP
jgi:hypothetical protein